MPFYLIETGFSPEIMKFYEENWYYFFTTSLPNFFPMPNLDIIYDVKIAVTWEQIDTN